MRKFKRLKKYLPKLHDLQKNKYLSIFGGLLSDPCIWKFNRRTVAMGFSVGFFSMLMPIPFQMLLAAALAIVFRANLPLSIALVWVSNPLTMAPIFYLTYYVGTKCLGMEMQRLPHIELSWDWLAQNLHTILQPFLLGTFICAISGALLGYVVIRLIWRIVITFNYWRRKKQRGME